MWVIFDDALDINDSATITVDGNANFTTAANDMGLVYAETTTTFLFKPFPNAPASGRLTLATEQATTSGSSINFASIPAWVRRITIQLVGVSADGTTNLQIQIGDADGIETSGYLSAATQITTVVATSRSTSAFVLTQATETGATHHGQVILTLEDAANNTWTMSSVISQSDADAMEVGAGSKSLSAPLTQLSLIVGADAFDAGAVNILYE